VRRVAAEPLMLLTVVALILVIVHGLPKTCDHKLLATILLNVSRFSVFVNGNLELTGHQQSLNSLYMLSNYTLISDNKQLMITFKVEQLRIKV